MRIDELKRIAKENDYEYSELEDMYKFTKQHRNNFISISKNKEKRIWITTPIICDEKDFNMTKAAVEFSETPPEDREVEKKFLIQHKYLVSKAFYPVCMVWHKLKDVYRPINCRVDNHIYKAQFTLKEIEEIKKKFDTDLKDFELVEVEE